MSVGIAGGRPLRTRVGKRGSPGWGWGSPGEGIGAQVRWGSINSGVTSMERENTKMNAVDLDPQGYLAMLL